MRWAWMAGENMPKLGRAFFSTTARVLEKSYIPRRAVMYVPGNDDRKIAKIPGLGADCIVLDCEDGVAINKKVDARQNIRKLLDNKAIDFGRSECTVRVNSVGIGGDGLCSEDLETILPTRNLPSAIHLPKVDTLDQLKWFFETSSKILKGAGRRGEDYHEGNKIRLILFIESAQAMLNLPQICATVWGLSTKKDSFFVPDALVFGSDDYCADIGAIRSKEAHELLYARQYLVMVAKAYKLQAIDVVYIDYKDTEGLRKQSLEGAGMGFTGKQIIHPGQVANCQESFTPSPEKISWARDLIKEFGQHQSSGKGAFNFRGSMIDMPLVLQAQNIVQLADRIEGTVGK